MEVNNGSITAMLTVMIPPRRPSMNSWGACGMVVASVIYPTVNPVNDRSMEDLLEGTIHKIERFKELGFQVEVKWECEF